MEKQEIENICANCVKWDAYERKRGYLWYGHCEARRADTWSEHKCFKFKAKDNG